jgi:protein gp37
MSDAYWRKPLKWNEQAEKEGRRYRVFCASMADVFEDRPELAGWRLDLFRLIVHTRNLDWLLLTKRPENIVSMMDSMGWPFMLANAWVGTTVENQEQADRRIPQLLAVPAVVRFLSCEPLLGPVDLSSIPDALYDTGMPFSWNKLGGDERGIKWVIAGGESGHGARPMHPDWVRSLRDQCQAAGVPFFFKQWGEWLPGSHFSITEHTDMSRIMQFGDGQIMQRVGKKQSGRLLAGVEWNQFPGGEA